MKPQRSYLTLSYLIQPFILRGKRLDFLILTQVLWKYKAKSLKCPFKVKVKTGEERG